MSEYSRNRLLGMKVSLFPLSQYISRSTSTYRTLCYGKIETQTSYISIYMYMYFSFHIILWDFECGRLEES